jgi:hypothetical protein
LPFALLKRGEIIGLAEDWKFVFYTIICNDPNGDGPIKYFPSIYASSTFLVS